MNNFNEIDFKTKVTNMIIQYFTCIMKNDLSNCKHFLKEQPINYATSIIDNMVQTNKRKMYDELNVSNIVITNTTSNEESTIYNINVDTKYLDYAIDLTNGNIIGNNNYRISKTYHFKIIKKNGIKEESIIYRCPSCGNSLDINYSGKCPYCGTIFNQEDYDYQILEIKE